MRRVLPLFAVIAGACPLIAANLTYVRLDPPIIESRLALKPVDQAARLTMLRNQFLKAGCSADQVQEQHVAGQDQPNLICTLPGTERGSIVIAARSDFQSKGDEAKVDWATLAMLPLLAESLYQVPHRYSFVFIALSGHKDLEGSATYLKSLTDDERRSIRAMVDLEQIGRTPATYSYAVIQSATGLTPLGPTKQITHDDIPMSKLLPLAAISLNLMDFGHHNRVPLNTDALNFELAGVQALTITSPAYSILVRTGNTEVPMARTELDPKIYYDTYNLLCVYTLYLDRGIAPPRGTVANVAPAPQPVPDPQPAPSAQTTPASTPVPAPATAVAKPLLPASSQITTANVTPPAVVNTQPVVVPAPAPDLPSTPVFHSTTRLVQVDVVVTDKAGNPITGLKQEDFAVLQDGKPQPVKAFEAHDLTQAAPQARVISKLREANTYTNTCTNSGQDPGSELDNRSYTTHSIRLIQRPAGCPKTVGQSC